VLATYTGQNVPSGEVIPSFEGDPIEAKLEPASPTELVLALNSGLGPKQECPGIISPGADFRVGEAAVYHRSDRQRGKLLTCIHNSAQEG